MKDRQDRGVTGRQKERGKEVKGQDERVERGRERNRG